MTYNNRPKEKQGIETKRSDTLFFYVYLIENFHNVLPAPQAPEDDGSSAEISNHQFNGSLYGLIVGSFHSDRKSVV